MIEVAEYRGPKSGEPLDPSDSDGPISPGGVMSTEAAVVAGMMGMVERN